MKYHLMGVVALLRLMRSGYVAELVEAGQGKARKLIINEELHLWAKQSLASKVQHVKRLKSSGNLQGVTSNGNLQLFFSLTDHIGVEVELAAISRPCTLALL